MYFVSCTIWEFGGSNGVQNTPTWCGNHFHTRPTQFRELYFLVFWGYGLMVTTTVACFFAKTNLLRCPQSKPLCGTDPERHFDPGRCPECPEIYFMDPIHEENHQHISRPILNSGDLATLSYPYITHPSPNRYPRKVRGDFCMHFEWTL